MKANILQKKIEDSLKGFEKSGFVSKIDKNVEVDKDDLKVEISYGNHEGWYVDILRKEKLAYFVRIQSSKEDAVLIQNKLEEEFKTIF